MSIGPKSVAFSVSQNKTVPPPTKDIKPEEAEVIAIFVSKILQKEPVAITEHEFLKNVKNRLRELNHPTGPSFISSFQKHEHHPLSVISLTDLCKMRQGFISMRVSGNNVGAELVQAIYFSNDISIDLYNRLLREEKK